MVLGNFILPHWKSLWIPFFQVSSFILQSTQENNIVPVQNGINHREYSSYNRGFTKGTICCIMNARNGKRRNGRNVWTKKISRCSRRWRTAGTLQRRRTSCTSPSRPCHRATERELGVELLLRSHQGIQFTPSGEAVLAHCRAAAPEMEQMRRKLVCGFRHCLRGDGKTGPGLGNRSGNRAERI